MSADEDVLAEYTTFRHGVHARPIVEVIADVCDLRSFFGEDVPDEEDHDTCLSLWVAARWPEPHSFHDLDLSLDGD